MKYTIAALIVLSTSAIKVERSGDYFVSESGHDGIWTYNRATPENFDGAGSGDDQFMNSMITNYAMERADKDTHKPTGYFYFNPIAARMASMEILKTHLKLEGKAAEDYLDKYFNKTWDHFDTADEGEITTDRMASFFRFLTANMQIILH